MELIFFILVLLVLIGPLAHIFGADSRVHDERGWWPDLRR
jgi:hypothetical protein